MAANKIVVLITGATQGLGYATAQALGQRGVFLVVVGARSPVKAAQAIKSLSTDKAVPIPESAFYPITIDLTSDTSINMAVLHVQKEFGRLDILINNAGVTLNSSLPNLRQQWFEIFNTNVFGTTIITQSFLPLLRKSNYPHKRIVNVSSGMGSLVYSEDPHNPYNVDKVAANAYRATKAALNMLTVTDAAQLKKEGIEVVSVCPGFMKTNFNGNTGYKDPKEGARAVVRAATAFGVNGTFISDDYQGGFFPW